MPRIIELTCADARAHFLKGSSYFNGDFPRYISFEPILQAVAVELGGGSYATFKGSNPHTLPNVNYSFIANKDGKFAWRPFELIHPVLYVSLVNALTNCVFRRSVTARFGIVTAEFGSVTDHFGDVTEGCLVPA